MLRPCLYGLAWVPNTASRRTIACNMAAAQASCCTFWSYLVLVVIVLSTVTSPPFFFKSTFAKVSSKVICLFDEAEFDIKQSTLFFCFANSFVNPLVYTLRMKEFRKGARVWCGSVNINTASRSQIVEMNKVTG